MPLRVVQRIRKVWGEIGEVCQDRTHLGRAPIMSSNAVDLMLGLIEHSPDIYLDEIQEQLLEQHGLDISLATIWRTLKHLGIGSKKLSKAAAECCDEARHKFALEIGNEPPERIVTRDKSAVNILTTFRANGWAYTSVHSCKCCNFVHGVRYSLLPAITMHGIIYSHIKMGGYNGDEFLEWLQGHLQVMNPYPAVNSVLVLDNCRIHHVEGVEEMCEERRVKLVYLPPYSPDLNLIEECFSFVKAYIHRHGQEFWDIVENGDAADPYLFLYAALDAVTPEASHGWFHNSGYI
ncbi:hypothetical protein Hypma_005272 [Hypsizygus marmoreus]|uniref:Tc1-like transposase DDE domain-containing protein n=1 Tax=Hypsizygus marmoreus TaxID=39966 RepID=A0A369JZX4_HYPMA|nr:hypothetical protein Hypma_005272 [Hypsizygus marmoreus]